MTRGLATSRSRNDMHFPAFSSRLSVISAQCHCFFFRHRGPCVCVDARLWDTCSWCLLVVICAIGPSYAFSPRASLYRTASLSQCPSNFPTLG